MSMTRLQAALAACTLATLAGCGGGNDNPGPGSSPAPGIQSEVPASALTSVSALVAYLQDVIAGRTNDTGEPVVLGDVTLPTSDTSETLPLR